MRQSARGWQAAWALTFALLTIPMAAPVAAAPSGAGVATAITGQVTVSRPTSPTQQPLRFKDEIYLRDHISTAANSLARLLLDKKALITVRELSELEITDQAGTSTVHLGMGKIAIGVARQRMRSGETVEVRTQNAVAAIRGTVVVAETLPSLGGTIPVSRLHVLRGYIDVSAPGNPGAPPIRMVAPSSVTVTGDTVGQPESLTDAAKAALLADLTLPGTYLTGLAESLAIGEQARAVALARIITGEGSGGDELLDLQAPPADPLAPITPPVPTTNVASTAVSGPVSSLPSVFNRQTVTIKGDFYTVPSSSTQNISTDLLEATTSTLTVGSNVLTVMGSMSSTTTLPFMSLSSSTLGAKDLAFLDGGSLSLTGTLLDAVNSAVSMTGSALVDVRAGGFLTGSSASPFVSFTNGSLTVTSKLLDSGARGFLFETGSTTALAGGLLRTNGTDITTGDLLSVTGRVTGSGTGAFLALADGTVSATDVGLIGSGGRLSLAGGLLDRSGATLATTDDLLNISAGGQLTGTGTGALLSFTNAAANIGNGTGDQYFQVTGAGSSAALAGPLLTASGGSTLRLTGSALVDVSTSGTLTDTTTSPLMSLTGGTLQIAGANGFAVSSLGTVNLSGGLLSTSGTAITSTGDFVLGQTKGRFVVTSSAAPLLSLAGGTSTIATNGSIFHLIGTTTALDPVTGLTLGTEEPIQHGAGFLDMNAATVTTARVVRVDVALLQASAPLLIMFGGAQLTASSNVIDLTGKAKATNTGTFVALDQSRLIVNNGALVRVAEGSFLRGSGNVINLANGSTLTINNGVLLFVSGGSVVNISGALIAFSGSGNIVNVSNTLSFVMIGGIPVALTGGALQSNVIITGTPIKNPTLGSITPHTALIQVNGPTTKLTISGN